MHENNNLKRLVIDLPQSMHNDIKSRAAIRNIPLRTWVIRALQKAINDEKQYE